MKIVYLHQYFATPESATGTRSYEFAKRWVRKGHQVTMITSTVHIPDAYCKRYLTGKNRVEFDCEGISVIALDVKYDNRMGKLRRAKSFVEFCMRSSSVAMQIKDVDVVFATSTPLTIAIPALWVKYRRNIPYVFEVRDLWPYTLIGNKAITNPLMIKLSLWYEKLIYAHADYVVGLSPSMKEYIDEVTGRPDKTVSASNCSDIDEFKPVSAEQKREIKREMGWQDKFVVGYTGTIGKVNGLDRMVEYARILREIPNIHFVIIGKGAQEDVLRGLVLQYELKNVELVGEIPKKKLSKVIPAMDVGLVSFHKRKHSETNSANKFFDYLASGIPVIVNYGGWQEEALRRAEAGFGAPGFDDDLTVENILKLYHDPQLRLKLGRNARLLAEREFARDLLSDRVLQQIQKCHDDYYSRK